MAKQPAVLWAQRESNILLTIEVDDAKIDDLKAEGSKLHFAGSSHSEKYEATMELFDEVKGDELKKANGTRFIEISIPKKEDAWWPRLLKEKGKVHWLKVDFSKWKDEDEVDDEKAPGMGGFDFGGGADGFDLNSYMSKMGGAGAGGIPDLDGFDDEGAEDDMPELEENDDEEAKGPSTSGLESKA
ncbi:hypothetical protein WR25_02125 [Diploscapter pachys]|uniref:CS domain-containing protein n=1 Tax=Diploscapter pachys TaxID=2018661 RepID=A0A2A2LCL4_9BILA|nr:hypothetical protein WR25_02125 [Diploscapter pachys]